MAKNKTIGWMALLGVIVGAGLVWVFMNGVPGGLSTVEKAPAVGTTTSAPLVTCGGDVTPDLDVNCVDAESPGTQLTEASVYRKVGDSTWTQFNCGTEQPDLEVGEQYEFVLGVGTSDTTESMYGPHFITDPLECKADTSITKQVYNDNSTPLTYSYWNADDQASTAQPLAANEQKKFQFRFEAPSDTVCGDPFIEGSGVKSLSGQRDSFPNVVCFDLNSTEFDAPAKVMYDGVELKQVSVPQRHPISSEMRAYCYEYPVVKDTMERSVIILDSDDTTDPSHDGTVTVYCADWFINGDTSEINWGVEDEDGNAVGSSTGASGTVNIS